MKTAIELPVALVESITRMAAIRSLINPHHPDTAESLVQEATESYLRLLQEEHGLDDSD